MGKHHHLSLGKHVNKSEKPVDQIPADVCGPMPVQSLGCACYLVCVNDTFLKFTAKILKNNFLLPKREKGGTRMCQKVPCMSECPKRPSQTSSNR